MLDISVEGLTAVQVALAKRNGRDIISASSGRLGISLAGAKPGDFSPIVDGHILPSYPFDPVGPAISKNKLLIVGYNRDEEAFLSPVRGSRHLHPHLPQPRSPAARGYRHRP